MNKWKLAGVLSAVIAAGVLGLTLRGVAAPKEKKDATIGFVDLGQVTDQIKKTSTWQVMTKKFDDERGKFQEEIASLTKIRYLSKQEREELTLLKAKAKASDAEKAKIEELEKRSDAMDKKFQELASIEKPTAEQSKEIQDLAKMRETAINALQEETAKRSESLRELESQVLEEMQKKILGYVEQVAENKNLAMVVDRQAILFGGTDLTPEVLKKLGGTAPK